VQISNITSADPVTLSWNGPPALAVPIAMAFQGVQPDGTDLYSYTIPAGSTAFSTPGTVFTISVPQSSFHFANQLVTTFTVTKAKNSQKC
jgi:hypothetical protein